MVRTHVVPPVYGDLAELVEGTFLLRRHRGTNSDHWFESNTLHQRRAA